MSIKRRVYENLTKDVNYILNYYNHPILTKFSLVYLEHNEEWFFYPRYSKSYEYRKSSSHKDILDLLQSLTKGNKIHANNQRTK